jgi:hypothetical protein
MPPADRMYWVRHRANIHSYRRKSHSTNRNSISVDVSSDYLQVVPNQRNSTSSFNSHFSPCLLITSVTDKRQFRSEHFIFFVSLLDPID